MPGCSVCQSVFVGRCGFAVVWNGLVCSESVEYMEKYRFLGFEWAVLTRGSGRPVVFVHGFPFDHSMYAVSCLPLSDEFRIVLPDLPGFGGSVFPEGSAPIKITMADYADGLAELLDCLHEEKAIVCGLSMGGYIAMQFMRRHADRLAGLVLCDTRSTPDTPEVAANRIRLADSVFETGAAPLAGTMLPNLLSEETLGNLPKISGFVSDMIARQKPAGIAAAARGMAERDDSTPYLKDVSVPTLVLGGECDRISPPDAMKGLAGRISGAEYLLVPTVGHIPPLETPVFFSDAIRGFARRIYGT